MSLLRYRSLLFAAWLGACGGLVGCSPDPPVDAPQERAAAAIPEATKAPAETRPSLLLVVVDTFRADDASRNPFLRRLAQSGVSFTQAYSHTATTGPSHATLFTSRFPTEHKVRANGQYLMDRFVSLAEVLRDAGYQTAAFTSAAPLAGAFGLAQGFEYVDGIETKKGAREGRPCRKSSAERCGEQTIEEVRRWLVEGRDSTRPFFLFVHLYDPHSAYVAPKPFFRPRAAGGVNVENCDENREAYRGEVAYADHLLAQLFGDVRQAGAGARTLMVVTSDHGEAFGEHENCVHTGNLYEELVRIPLVFSWTGTVPAGRRIDQPVGLVDVAPTVLELLGVSSAPLDPSGTSLADLILGRTKSNPEAPVFFERRWFARPIRIHRKEWNGGQIGVRIGRWKYMTAPLEGTTELFDLEADPGEKHNVADEHPEVVDRLSSLLSIWKRETKARQGKPDTGQGPENDELKERLRELGYAS